MGLRLVIIGLPTVENLNLLLFSVSPVDENDRVECVFENYNNSASFTTNDVQNLLTSLAENDISVIDSSTVISGIYDNGLYPHTEVGSTS